MGTVEKFFVVLISEILLLCYVEFTFLSYFQFIQIESKLIRYKKKQTQETSLNGNFLNQFIFPLEENFTAAKPQILLFNYWKKKILLEIVIRGLS